jgi:hypothetical protein
VRREGEERPRRRWRRRVVATATLLAVLVASGAIWGITRGYHHRVYDAFFLAVVADRVAGESTSPADTVWRLHEFVNLNVRTPVAAPVFDTHPGHVLLRGFGYCDQAVWLFVGLLAERDISGRMTWLRRADGSSPHTVSEVLLDGEWRVFDTFYGWVPRRPDGGLVSVRDLVAEPALLGLSRAQPEWYRHTRVTLIGGPERLRRDVSFRMRARVSVVQTLVAVTPRRIVDHLQDLYLRLPLAPDPDTRVALDSPERRLFVRARHYHAFLRTAEAVAAYTEWLGRYANDPAADDVLYALGVLRLTQGRDPVEAGTIFDTLLARYPASDWRNEAIYLDGLSHELAGDCRTAIRRYGEVVAGFANGLEDARLRLGRLKCPLA